MKDLLEKLLRTKADFLVEGKINKNKVAELARKYDKELLDLLLSDNKIKEFFFVQAETALVFKLDVFLQFINNKSFLPDSYTKYKQLIGLGTDDGKLLSENRETVLNWPFKDCVLEGGQTKEDVKRKEVFFNEILAPDEINRLLDKKVLTNFKKFDLDGEHEVTELQDNDNLIIKGNNLIALHSLKKRFTGKVKSIFIDPPYNTGNDSFGYNDTFKHSTWLTFIKNRLEVAKELLSDDGSLSLTIDYNELAYIMAICDSVFGKENLQNVITVRRASVSGAKVINPGVVNISDYIVIYSKNKASWKPNKVFAAKERDNRYNQFIKNRNEDFHNWEFCSLLEAFADSQGIQKSKLKKELGQAYDRKLDEFAFENALSVFRFVSLDEGQISQEARNLKQKSKANPEEIFYMERPGYNDYYMQNGKAMLFMKERLIEVDGKLSFGTAISDIWDDVLPNDLHNEGGVSFKKGKKPEKLIRRILDLTSNEGDLVLDFFAGSGTTGAVAQKTKRRFILIEQMDYVEDTLLKRIDNTTSGKRTAGISSDVDWHGGGSFVYCELKNDAQDFKNRVLAANQEQVLELFDEARNSSFLSYRVKPEISHKNDFKSLSLAEQKQILTEIVDNNNLYVNYSDIDDNTYGISEIEKKLNREFYGDE